MNCRFLLIILLFIASFLYQSCAVNPVTGEKEFMLLSKSNEIAMGKQSDQEIVSYMGLYDDPDLQQFIKTKGEEMASISHRSELDFEFKIVDTPVVNAFAVPGGYVYFTRGILAHFNNEAEFAGVLGHEIGHVAARHSAKQYTKSMAAQAGLVAGSLLSEEFRQYAGLAQTGLQVLFLKFSRDHERQSDKLGVEYSTKIGYDAEEMAGFFNTLSRLSEQSGAEVPTFLSTHPNPANRYRDVQQLADKWQSKLNATNLEVNRDSYLRMIDGLIYGEDPRQGYVEDSRFYHPELKFQFVVPSGWTLQNTPQQVQMAPSDGQALLILGLARGNDLNEAAESFVTGNQLQQVRSERTSVNGYDALTLVANQGQEGGSTVQILAYFIQDDKLIYNFFGASNASTFSSYSQVFDRSIGSFARLTDPAKLNKEPERIQIVEARDGGTLRDLLKQSNVPDQRLEELALLNGMELEDRVASGTLIKSIR